ncbi:uncharacterized protein TNCV_1868481 [Trichonephila clavipes]|nr:uncharacterized protein TNCV_1868481 [Trichonephila clavipes]
MFGDRLISRFGPVNWPPRSCDLTPLDYFLWGYVKSLVYADKPQTLDHLEDNIRRVIADIRPQMLEKVIENWTSRLDYIRASRGSHMPEIIFKINCDENKTVVNTSLKSVQTSHDVNLRITQAFSHIGKGYSAIEKFCMVMNIDPFSSTTYGKCARRLDNAYTLASENIFAEIHREIKNVYENGAEITDLSVSFDGTWLTRGHTSLIGVGCVIDMLTGYVVDFEVMSKVCRHCSVAKNKLGQSSAEFSIWYEEHKSECDINHLGSSTSMEMEAALTLWKRSTSLGFRYITVLSDGDCKTFNYLCEKKCMDLTL